MLGLTAVGMTNLGARHERRSRSEIFRSR